MVIIGFDTSLTNTAVAIGDSPERFEVAAFPSKPFGDGPFDRIARSSSVAAQVVRWIKSHEAKFPVDLAACHDVLVLFEGYSFGSSHHREVLAEHRAIVSIELLAMFGPLPAKEISPGTLKKFVTGKGGSAKEEMRLGAYKQWGVEFRSNDEVDAYGLFRLGLCLSGIDKAASKAQREAVSALMAPKPKKPRKKRQAQS